MKLNKSLLAMATVFLSFSSAKADTNDLDVGYSWGTGEYGSGALVRYNHEFDNHIVLGASGNYFFPYNYQIPSIPSRTVSGVLQTSIFFAEIGYNFHFDNGFSVKPHLGYGIANVHTVITINQGPFEDEWVSDNATILGVDFRKSLSENLYLSLDLRAFGGGPIGASFAPSLAVGYSF